MEREDQFSNLELSKRLEELGVKQESLFYWWVCEEKAHTYINCPDLIPKIIDCKPKNLSGYSAFTASELGAMLPSIIPTETPTKQDLKIDICKDINNRWLTAYFYNFNLPPKVIIIGDTEADSRAKMLIYLIENGLIKNV